MSLHMADLGQRTFMAQCQTCDWHHTGTLAGAYCEYVKHYNHAHRTAA